MRKFPFASQARSTFERMDEQSPRNDQPADNAPAPYRLPMSFFSDPFDELSEEESSKPEDAFAAALLGEEEELELPSLAAPASAAEPLSLKERMGRMLNSLGESDDEHFAGADVSGPSLSSRLKARRRSRATAAPALATTTTTASIDQFERLLTPLAGPALVRLSADVAGDDLLFVSYENDRHTQIRRHGLGLSFALAVLSLFFVAAGLEYISDLATAIAPAWMNEEIGADPASMVLFGLGMILPFFTLGAISDTYVFGARSISERSLLDLACSIVSACFAAGTLALLLGTFPLQAGLVLTVWMLTRILIDVLSGRRRS